MDNSNKDKLQLYFDELCIKVKLLPIKIIEQKDIDIAGVKLILLFYFIAIGPKFDSFDFDEAKWILAHELGHVCDKNFKYNWYLDRNTPIKIYTIILCVYLFLLFLCWIFPGTLLSSLIVSIIIFIMCKKISSRWKQKEYDADIFATQYVGKEIGVRALEKMKILDPSLNTIYWNIMTWMFGTHPSTEDRIRHIERFK